MYYVNTKLPVNFFRSFDIASKKFWIAGADRIPAFLDSGLRTADIGRAEVIIAAPENEYLTRRLNRTFGKLRPSSFMMTLPGKRLWIGGSDPEGLSHAIKFASKVIPVLSRHFLVKCDFHIHSTVSDGWSTPADIVTHARRAGINVIALTDHNSDAGTQTVIAEACKYGDLLVVRGMEVTDARQNHVLVLGDGRGLPGQEPESIISAAERDSLFIAQAHATSDIYFRELNDGRFIAAEAFNYLSSAPLKAREYLRQHLDANRNIAALGNSDAHMSADIGKAFTCMLIRNFSVDEVMQKLRAGECCAFCRGDTVGKKPVKALVDFLYSHSDMLEPPAAIRGNGKTARLEYINTLRHDRRHIYCPAGEECDCLEIYHRIAPGTRSIRTGRRRRVVMTLNHIRKEIELVSGEGENLARLLKNGTNRLRLDVYDRILKPRLCLGREIRDFRLLMPDGRTEAAFRGGSNFQIHNLLPRDAFEGKAIITASVENTELHDRLFFESVDGNVEIYVNGECVARRYGTHWEERFELAFSPAPVVNIEIILRNHAGLCGISNHAYIGRSLPLTSPICFERNELCEIRCGEQRMRSFILDENFSVIDCFFDNGTTYEPDGRARYMMTTSFQNK